MNNPTKSTLLFLLFLSFSSLLLTGPTIAQPAPQPSIIELSLNYLSENNSIIATIKNPSGADAFNFKWKEHDSQTWYYSPFHTDTSSSPYFEGDTYGVPSQASSSGSTELVLSFIPKTQMGKQLDIQVQALYGTYKAVPYGHAMVLPGGPTYDFYFEGQAGDWSSTQTVTYGKALPSPTVPEFPTIALLPILAAVPLIAALLIRKYAANSATRYYKKR